MQRLSVVIAVTILGLVACAERTPIGGSEGLTRSGQNPSDWTSDGQLVPFAGGQVWIGVVQAKELKTSEKAFLDVIAAAEGTSKLPNCGRDGGYTAKYGCFQDKSRLDDAPFTVYSNPKNGRSSAATGRYQFMPFRWKELGFRESQASDPATQDRAALASIRNRGAYSLLSQVSSREGRHDRARFAAVINHLAPEWASFPTSSGRSYYAGQPAKPLEALFSLYVNAYKAYATQ